jgi:hypothetical protein
MEVATIVAFLFLSFMSVGENVIQLGVYLKNGYLCEIMRQPPKKRRVGNGIHNY